MRRFEFKLERVLRYKQQRERLAEIRQKQAAAALKLVRDEIARLEGQLKTTAAIMEQQLGEMGVTSWLACHAQAVRIGKAIETAEARANQARLDLLEANARRQQATIEVEGILTLRHKEWQAHRRAAERQEQQRGDELAVRRWQMARRAGSTGGVTTSGPAGGRPACGPQEIGS
jgi:flagellar export protein FliJ